jgi:hypothetical protein
MACEEPRSTSSHCGSENPLDQRVPVFPSTAADAGNEAFCDEDAAAGWYRARFAGPRVAARAAGSADQQQPAQQHRDGQDSGRG